MAWKSIGEWGHTIAWPEEGKGRSCGVHNVYRKRITSMWWNNLSSQCVFIYQICNRYKKYSQSNLKKLKLYWDAPCRHSGGKELYLLLILNLDTVWGWVVFSVYKYLFRSVSQQDMLIVEGFTEHKHLLLSLQI